MSVVKVLASGQAGVSGSRVNGAYYFPSSALGLLTHRLPAVWVLGH